MTCSKCLENILPGERVKEDFRDILTRIPTYVHVRGVPPPAYSVSPVISTRWGKFTKKHPASIQITHAKCLVRGE